MNINDSVAKYEGQTQDGRRHGFGKAWLSDGAIYEGEWSHDKMNGLGV